MKQRTLLAIAAFALLGSLSALRAAFAPGQSPSDVSFTDLSGTTHSLTDFKGKIVVFEWVNPECPFVKYHYEKAADIPGLQKRLKDEGVVWISVNSGHAGAQGDFDPAAVKAWMAKTGAQPMAYVRDSDGRLGKLFGAKTTPHLFIFNIDGKLVYEGAIDDARGFNLEKTKAATNYVRATVDALKSGKPVAHDSVQPYGCSVKY